ncbi:RidA family protein [Pseudomonas sp. CC120222-01a]|uniref:RidA family protein n=1 Tax=Pseudomonas sp. CC120222-01a TaxID=1378075 RepID=UPI000D848E52|nr:RidA family protein [Pseudomonas sp. CC120222-01a]PVZ41185.1 enamine deaminase RidA (YjgF/YER057c/UK114 family) [Pseudomonas sp. CC120222-01a]
MIERKLENELMAQVVSFGHTVETAGQVADDISKDVKGQAAEAFAKIDHLLSQVGASKQDLTRIQMWLADMKDFDHMNEVYAQWLAGSGKPVRACVGAELVAGGYLIEVQAFAYRQR